MDKQEQLELYISTHTADFEEVLREQTDKGQKTYGQLTDPLGDYPYGRMAKEELVDAYVYVDMLEQRMKLVASKLRKLTSYKPTEQTRMEINAWLDILEGK